MEVWISVKFSFKKFNAQSKFNAHYLQNNLILTFFTIQCLLLFFSLKLKDHPLTPITHSIALRCMTRAENNRDTELSNLEKKHSHTNKFGFKAFSYDIIVDNK